MLWRLKLAGRIRRESAYYIGARSFMAATRPDIELQPTVNVKTTKA
ncbi:oxidoreductase, partial [Escherichia coli]|nr:oxidoreductase [Escherichia coli]EFO3029322.1 oxidoreductase [Escherichia coli]